MHPNHELHAIPARTMRRQANQRVEQRVQDDVLSASGANAYRYEPANLQPRYGCSNRVIRAKIDDWGISMQLKSDAD